MQNFFSQITVIELLCFIISLWCLTRQPLAIWWLFIAYLAVICVTEIIGLYLKKHHLANQWPYNISLLFQVVIISAVFKHLLHKYTIGKPIIIGGFAIMLALYVYETIVHGFLIFNNLTYDVLSVIFVVYALVYFYFLLKDEHYIDLRFNADFWWVTGVLIFYFGSTQLNLFRGKLSKIPIQPGFTLPHLINIILNYILYFSWSYSFLCRKLFSRNNSVTYQGK